MSLVAQIKTAAEDALKQLYPDVDISASTVAINQTKPEFEGDYTLVLFPFLKLLRNKPNVIGEQIGEYLITNSELFSAYHIVAGFLNLTVSEAYWVKFLSENYNNLELGKNADNGKRVMVEYSSPNTNKPLHFGHMRNIFLGYAMSGVLQENGNTVVKANLINDRGVHICKSMVAWLHFANGATPESSNTKGDHLVGEYYVKFNTEYKEQLKPLTDGLYKTKEIPDFVNESDSDKLKKALLVINNSDEKEKVGAAKSQIEQTLGNYTPLLKEAKDMLQKWEAGDEEVVTLWKTMNSWVYDGFHITYNRMGVDFDAIYYESNTYLLGKAVVEKGLKKNVLYQKEDGSVWIDLTDDGLDQKLLLRADGTSVYMTQDIGTAIEKYNDHGLDKSLYVIGDEQNYHMQVLALILKKMGEPCADGIYHLSYGMVELPTGKMKSREGTVVDADDMLDEMVGLAQKQTEEAGKTEGFTDEELVNLYETIGLGALKFYLLRVDPKRKMVFDPKESIDLHGFTATFIQYAHARICSILRKEGLPLVPSTDTFKDYQHSLSIEVAEKKLIVSLEQYPTIVAAAAEEYNPSLICNYIFQVAQEFNSFYAEHSIAQAENEQKKQLRLMLIVMTAQVIRRAMGMLGISVPEKM